MMRSIRSVVLASALLCGGAGCGASPGEGARCPEVTPPEPALAELEAVHQKLVAAYRANDVATLERLVSPDHVHNNVFGMIQNKEALLGDMRSGTLAFKAYDVTSSRWFLHGDMATVTGTLRAEAERAGKRVPSAEFRFTRIFERRAEGWQELLFQNTMVVAPPGKR